MDLLGTEKSWPLDNYSKWERTNKKWEQIPVDKGNCWLLLQGKQMLVVNGGIGVESVCLISSDISASYTTNYLGIAVKLNKGSVSRFKITFGETVGKTKDANCLEAVKELRKWIPVIEHGAHKGVKPNTQEQVIKTLSQVTKELLQTNSKIFKDTDLILSEDSIGETIQQCLLDPKFPTFVAKVEEILNKKIGEED
uniref:Uncharacterized protein n=1 Tax=Graphocephala atropunctata TaxID=36148 RepID=A0A1B6LKW8_9HEMI